MSLRESRRVVRARPEFVIDHLPIQTRSARQGGVVMRLPRLIAALAVAGFVLAPTARADAQTAVAIDADDIGGVVTGPHGPEAGVWVIAETRDLPTRFAKMVVTDDQGRYVVPDLPAAKYQLWVRGYGLIDSPKLDAAPGQHVNLTAVPAPNDAAAAQY